MRPEVKIIRTYKDRFETELMEEIRNEFRDYRYYDIGFGSLLRSLIQDLNEQVLNNAHFREEIKYELKLIMSYLHMVRDKNLIRDLKSSLFPMLVVGVAGNRTVIKQIILATHLAPKALSFITQTYRDIVEREENLDPELIAELYTQMLSDLRRVHNKHVRIDRIPDEKLRERKKRQLSLFKTRQKNRLRKRLSLPLDEGNLDDPYRLLPVIRVRNQSEELSFI